MKDFLRNTGEFLGEATGLRSKNWAEVQASHYEAVKDGLGKALGWVTMSATLRGDYEAVRLEQKRFLHELAEDTEPDRPTTLTQRAAQELLDELYDAGV